MRTLRKRQKLFSLLALFMLLSMMFAVPVSADHPGDQLGASVAPEFVDGNPTCSDLVDAGDFEFETKIEPVASGTYDLDGNLDPNGPITIVVRNTAQGQVFDFELDGFVTMGVVAKGGPNANFYDYRPDGVSSDVDLHAPVNHNNNRFFGLSHISFCLVEAAAALAIEKTAVEDPITIGDVAAFDILVTSLGPSTAENVVITDSLAAGFDWEVVAEDIDGACAITADGDGDLTQLECSIGDLDPDETFSVRVATTAGVTADDCYTTLENTAFANADNADQVQDDATIDIHCGAIQINKTAKQADADDGVIPLAGAEFTVFDNGNALGSDTTGDNGIACIDRLPLNVELRVSETLVPAGYSGADDFNVTLTENADCDGVHGAPHEENVSNDPLSDVEIIVTSQIDGATQWKIECVDSEGNTFDNHEGTGDFTTEGLVVTDLLPTDPDVTLTCEITIDP